MVEQIKTDLDLLWKECFDSELDFTVEQMQFIGLTMSQIKQRLEVSRDTEVILPKPTPLPFTFNGQRLFTYSDLEKAYNDGYKNGMMNEAGLECTLFSSWYNWVHEIKGKSKA